MIRELAEKTGMSEAECQQLLVDNHVWTVALLAAAGGVSGQYIRQLLGSGRLAGVNPGGGWVISRADGDAWLRSRGIEVDF